MTVTAPTNITALPTPPSTSSPSDFNTKADAFLGAFPTLRTEVNAIATNVYGNAQAAETAATGAEADALTASIAAQAAVSASGYLSAFTGSMNLAATTQTPTIDAGLAFAAGGGEEVIFIRASDRNTRLFGTTNSYNSGTGAASVTIASYVGTGGPYTDWIVVLAALATDSQVGKQAVWIPAGAMYPRTTTGAARGTMETTTNKIVVETLDFDATTQEYAQFGIGMPKAWNEGTVTFQPIWTHGSTATNFGVVWSMRAVAISNDDALDAAFGTAQTSTDTGGTTDDLYAGPESAAITIAGTPVAEDYVVYEISRTPAAGSDTMAIDAKLIGVRVFISVAAENDS